MHSILSRKHSEDCTDSVFLNRVQKLTCFQAFLPSQCAKTKGAGRPENICHVTSSSTHRGGRGPKPKKSDVYGFSCHVDPYTGVLNNQVKSCAGLRVPLQNMLFHSGTTPLLSHLPRQTLTSLGIVPGLLFILGHKLSKLEAQGGWGSNRTAFISGHTRCAAARITRLQVQNLLRRSSYHVQVRTVRSCRSPHDRCHLCVKTARLRGESLVLKDTLAKQHEKRNICSMEGGERVHQL